MSDPRLNWVPSFDPRSRQYPIRGLIADSPVRRNHTWKIGPILDQGQEGACVGFGWTAEALAQPVAVNLRWVYKDVPRDPTAFAHHVYKAAQKIDEWPGENYSGTSVLAGAKTMNSIGLVREYRWAFSLDDVIDTVLTTGPVVVGTDWYNDMYRPVNGVVKVGGRVVGGHCYLIIGYRTKPAELGGVEDALVVQNSWGADWGTNGTALLSLSDAEFLFNRAEACVVTKRSFGWSAAAFFSRLFHRAV